MSNQQINQIEQVCRELGEVQAFIKLVPKVHRIIEQVDAIDLILQLRCGTVAREELQVLRSEIAALIKGGVQ